jgi:hypothetical protein
MVAEENFGKLAIIQLEQMDTFIYGIFNDCYILPF